MIAALISECFGTIIFFYCILATGNPIAIVVGLLAAIYAFSQISGGHFNPGVSYLMYLKGDINLLTFIAYVIAQLIGATITLIWWKSTLGKGK